MKSPGPASATNSSRSPQRIRARPADDVDDALDRRRGDARPVFASGSMSTVPAHSFSAPARAAVIAAARLIPGVCGVFGSSSSRAHDPHAVQAPVACGLSWPRPDSRDRPSDAGVSRGPEELGGPERVARTLGNMEGEIGYVPGFRRAHGRGVALPRGSSPPRPRPPR